MKFSKNRFEFFSDGVMAIIITIMVLEIPLTDNFTLVGIIHLLKSIFIFFASFLIVGYFWNKHHFLFDRVEKITNKIVWRNLIFLFFLALLPIFTKWVLENPNHLVPAIGYDILFVIVNLSYFFVVKGLKKEKRHDEEKFVEMSREYIRHHQLHVVVIVIIAILIVALAILLSQYFSYLIIGFPIIYSLVNMLVDKPKPEDRKNDLIKMRYNRDDFDKNKKGFRKNENDSGKNKKDSDKNKKS